MFRILKKKLGVIIRSSCSGEIEQNVLTSHVDDADFCTSCEECEKKMQEIINYYAKMHEATGGKVQKRESFNV